MGGIIVFIEGKRHAAQHHGLGENGSKALTRRGTIERVHDAKGDLMRE